MARSDRATCRTLLTALTNDGPNGVLSNGLARAGETGTLSRRMNGTNAVGKVRAKTGTLLNVSGLAGWALPPERTPVAFAIVNNGIDSESARRFEDQMAILLTNLPPPPPASQFAPEAVR